MNWFKIVIVPTRGQVRHDNLITDLTHFSHQTLAMNTDAVYIVDDDSDDQEIVREVWEELGLKNPLIFFDNGQSVLDQLKMEAVPLFLIICDVNIPRMDGFELRERIINDVSMKYRGVPFIFWSTQASGEQIKKAYDLYAHGFFVKEVHFEKIRQSLKDIIAYWSQSRTPFNL